MKYILLSAFELSSFNNMIPLLSKNNDGYFEPKKELVKYVYEHVDWKKAHQEFQKRTRKRKTFQKYFWLACGLVGCKQGISKLSLFYKEVVDQLQDYQKLVQKEKVIEKAFDDKCVAEFLKKRSKQ